MESDAFPSRLLKTLSYLGMLPTFDAVKLPHHGSENNVSTQLIEALASPLYIFSTDGAKFKHPSRQAVARVVRHGNSPLLAFNYKTEFNEMWDNPLLSAKYGSKAVYMVNKTASQLRCSRTLQVACRSSLDGALYTRV